MLQNNRKLFPNSVVELPDDGSTAHGVVVQSAMPVPTDKRIRLHFSLSMDPALSGELAARVAKGEVVGADELNSKYSASGDASGALMHWLQTEGFVNVHETPDHLSVYAEASIGQIQQSLQVSFASVTKDGITHSAAKNVPSLPADVGGAVRAIAGLQPFRHANKHRVQRRSAAPAGTNGFEPADILKAYNADTVAATGAGQVIGILIDTFPLISDITAFWTACGIPANTARIQMINVSGATLDPPEGEESLDAEWSSGIATGATIRIYASGSLQFVDLDAALDRIIADVPTTPGFHQLSISLGLGETYMGAVTGEPTTQDEKYLRLAALGVNVFISTGDAGSRPDQTGHTFGGPLQAEYASTDPWVIAVGGTSLTMDGTGAVTSEIGWSGGGGGISQFWNRPAWQADPTIPAGPWRLVPDVSSAADPNTGCMIVVNGNQQQIGGTSWSAPTWAAFCALINDARSQVGKPPVGFLNPSIYPLRATAAFRDITSGSNGDYTAAAGYDMVTGLGVPNVSQLIALLP